MSRTYHPVAFPGRVRAYRKVIGWTLDELAAQSGLSKSYLSDIENEKANATLTAAHRIASAFGVQIPDLLEE